MTNPLLVFGILSAFAFALLLALHIWREWQHDRERQAMRREARAERRGLLREALPHIEYAAAVVETPAEPYGGDAQEWQVARARLTEDERALEEDLEPNYV